MDRYVTDYLNARLSLYGTPVAPPLPSPVAKLRAWQKKRRVRRDLLALDDRLLADIGLDRAAIDPLVAGGSTPTANDNSAASATG